MLLRRHQPTLASRAVAKVNNYKQENIEWMNDLCVFLKKGNSDYCVEDGTKLITCQVSIFLIFVPSVSLENYKLNQTRNKKKTTDN